MKKYFFRYTISCIALILLTSLNPANAAIWKAKNQWNEQWENTYRAWVKKNWTEDFFMDKKKPIYYKYSHDCADAVYAMRLIFSYEHKLPFVIHNIHGKKKRGKRNKRSKRYISNSMRRWDRLPEAKRVRNFLDYVADMTSTKTLGIDTYPIALNQIKPGDIYAAPGVHSYQIVNVTISGVAEVMSSTTPKAPRFLDRIESFPFYVPEDTKHFRDGYRRFIQPQNIKKSQKKQPGYSLEQYKIAAAVKYNYVRFTDIIASALGKRPEKPDEKTLRLLIALCMYANDRSVYIYDALWHLQKIRKKGRKCMNRTEYDAYSTPSRDRRLKAFFNAVDGHFKKVSRYAPNTQPQRWARILFSKNRPKPAEAKELNNFCMVQMSLGEKYFMPLRELRHNLLAGKLVSNPNAPLEYRWGVYDTKKNPYKTSCKSY
ncbi:MAG TPA: hypothetical protein ENJ51_06690 [Leucothrix mucor]|uniref:Uncharacterized protein n=1 Tax=Leucothrix mucor TaxID=45248 RepID=A0A7V2WUW2_LEUMU|nr:hypothetical protein [Leucothrix mucor]